MQEGQGVLFAHSVSESKLKNLLCTAPVLAYTFALETDALADTIYNIIAWSGAVLAQEDEMGQLNPVA